MFNKPCKVCAQLKEENAYLKKLVDNLFQSKGVAPVDNQPGIVEESENEKLDRALAERGAIKYGD